MGYVMGLQRTSIQQVCKTVLFLPRYMCIPSLAPQGCLPQEPTRPQPIINTPSHLPFPLMTYYIHMCYLLHSISPLAPFQEWSPYFTASWQSCPGASVCWKKLSNIDISGWLINLAPSSGDPVPTISTYCLLFTDIWGKQGLWVHRLLPCVRTGSDQHWENCWTHRVQRLRDESQMIYTHSHYPHFNCRPEKFGGQECQQVAENLRLVCGL